MFEDIQYYFNKEQPIIALTSAKSQKDVVLRSNEEAQQISKETNKNNPEDIDEGPTLALFLLSNSRFQNMTNLNEQKNQKKNSSDSVKELDEEDQVEEQNNEETEQLQQVQIPLNESKNNEEISDDVFFQTEVVYFDNELQEIPIKNKSHSSVIPSQNEQNEESPIPFMKSNHITAQQQKMISSINEQNMLQRNSDQIGNSNFRNSSYNTTKSTLMTKSPTSNLYFRNDSALQQLRENNVNTLYKQKSTIVEKSLEMSNVIGSVKRKKKLSSQPHKLRFKWRFFLEFLFYHFLYLCLLGPLASVVIIYILKQKKQVCQNMGFIGITFMNFYQGFYTPNKMKMIKTKQLTWDEQKQDFIFGMWIEQTDEIIQNEIDNAKLRLEVESSSFYFEFMSRPPKHQMEKLLAPERKKIILKNFGNEYDITKLPYGTNLLTEYIRYYRNKFPHLWIKKFAFGISIFRQVYFIMVKVDCVMKLVDSKQEMANIIVINIFFAFMELFFWAQIIQILLLYFQDLRRKTFILNQMSHLISAKRVEIELEGTKKLYPTLELVCPISLRTWAQLRKITLEYGEKFSQRIQILISLFLSFFIIILVLYLLQSFNIISTINIQIEVLYLYIFDLSCIILITIKCIFMGGKINEHFDIHIQKLYQNKIHFTELLSKYDIWFKDDYVVVNPLFRRMIEDYRILKQNFNFDDQSLQQFIKDNVQLCRMQILDIEIQSKDNPYKVFGVAMTQQLGLTVLTAFVSLIGSFVGQYVYSQPDAISNLT